MRILYGVVGEGMGHATRSKVVISHLVEQGHQVKIVVSGRAHAYLQRFFPDVEEITGLKLIYENNAVHLRRSFRNFLKELPLWGGWAQNFESMTRIEENFDAEVVVSDFESFAYLYGQRFDVPVISIDNMQIMSRCKLDVKIPKSEKMNARLAKGVVKAKLPGCHHYLITTFFFPEMKKKKTTLVPPILRDEILRARQGARHGEHVLVYQTSDSYGELLPVLETMKDHRFIVYGLGRDEERGHVTLRQFGEQGFVDDFASARAVICGGGFSLISEAVYLGKPILSVPIRRQFEQTLNALYVEKLGYGQRAEHLDRARLEDFLSRHDEYARNLEGPLAGREPADPRRSR